MTKRSPASPPGSGEPVVIKQPPLDQHAPGPTSLRTVMVRRVHSDQPDPRSTRPMAVGLCVLLAAVIAVISLANIVGGSPTDAIRAVPPDQSRTPPILADSSTDHGDAVSPATITTSEPLKKESSTTSETTRSGVDVSILPTAAPSTTAPPAPAPTTAPPSTVPPTTVPTTLAPTASAPATTVATLPVTTVPSTAPEPIELPVPPTSLTSTTTDDDSVDTKPGRGNSDDAPGKGNKPEKDE